MEQRAINADAASRLAWAVEIARQAGAETLKWFRQPRLAVERKGDGSPVTAADRAAETLLREAIGERFPDDGIVGEEFGERPGTSPYRWVLDPIDGTKSFITGAPLYATLVAVMRGDDPLLGVIHAPATAETVYAAAGGACWYTVGDGDPEQSRVSTIDTLAEATFLTTSVRSFEADRTPGARRVYEQIEAACRLTRTWGDAYGYLLVATGRADVMIDPAMNLWDAAALQPIIEAAGGRFTDWQGRATVHSGDSIATNGPLHEQILAIAREPH